MFAIQQTAWFTIRWERLKKEINKKKNENRTYAQTFHEINDVQQWHAIEMLNSKHISNELFCMMLNNRPQFNVNYGKYQKTETCVNW